MLYVRADGSAKTGAGHLMRCLTVADEAAERSGVCFLCGDEASAAFAAGRGYEARVLSAEPFSAAEAEEICSLVGGKRPVLLADSYLITPTYVEALSACCDVALLDDMAAQPFFGARWIINYNFFADGDRYRRLYGSRAVSPAFLLGAAYIPLRPQFRNCRRDGRESGESFRGGLQRDSKGGSQGCSRGGALGEPRRVLITAGGGDHRNITGAVLECLMREEKLKKTELHVICGAFSPNLDSVQHLARLRDMIYVHQNVQDMAGLMARCDAAVTAGGTTVYELCAVGVPFVAFSYADNQEALVRYAGTCGIGIDAGDYRLETGEILRRIREGVVRLLDGDREAERFRRTAMEHVDGCGARRIIREIYGKQRGYQI